MGWGVSFTNLMGLDGMDGVSKVSFNFLCTSWVYRLCIYPLVSVIKFVTDILMGFKILCQVGDHRQKFLNYSRQLTFLFFDLKVHFFFFITTREAFFAKKYQFFIFLWLFIFIEDFTKDFTKDFIKDFNKGFTQDFTYDFVVRLFY